MKTNPLEYLIIGVIIVGLLGLGALLLFRPESLINKADSTVKENQLLARASVFMEHRIALSEVVINTDIFKDTRFKQLRNDRLFIPEQPVGKADLFNHSVFSDQI